MIMPSRQILYDMRTGEFILACPGEFMMNWNVSLAGSESK